MGVTDIARGCSRFLVLLSVTLMQLHPTALFNKKCSCVVQLQDEREASKKKSLKIKHLETQLSIYIGQSKQGSDHLSMNSLRTDSQDKEDKLHPNRGHASMQRYLAGQLTLNQQAELRHKLRTKSTQDNTGSKQEYTLRRNSLDSGRGSSQATVEVTSNQNVNKNKKSSICNILQLFYPPSELNSLRDQAKCVSHN